MDARVAWEVGASEVRFWFWVVVLVLSAGGAGGFLARDFIVKEAQRCLEAPDMDTARVCWDTATLGWKP